MSLTAATIRSGLIESTHPWSAVVVDDTGTVLDAWGSPDTPLFYRSAIKPLQAQVCLEAGMSLTPEHLAVACASHTGTSTHTAIVRQILTDGDLDETALQCPKAWPWSPATRHRITVEGRGKARVFHNCSGKHAAFLRTCVAAGWPLDSYLEPDHPLQRNILALVEEISGVPAEPVGIDGCGAPTLRGTLRGLAVAFAKLSSDPRFERVRTAMRRYPALTSGNERPDGQLARWWDGPAKCGAEGLMALGRHGIGIATASHEGSIPLAVTGIIEIARRRGVLSDAALGALDKLATPPIWGGDRIVGSIVPDVSTIDPASIGVAP